MDFIALIFAVLNLYYLTLQARSKYKYEIKYMSIKLKRMEQLPVRNQAWLK